MAYFKMIRTVCRGLKDTYQNDILANLIDTVLLYCMRFYNRQFCADELENSHILTRFENFLNKYYDTQKQLANGLLSVQLCASELCLSRNYFSDLIRKHTGQTASSHIHLFLISRARSLLMAGKTINETAYELGFEYPQHFSRLFKKIEGCTPTAYILKMQAKKGMQQ